MIVNLNGMVFNDYVTDENGVDRYVTAFDGWDDTEVRSAAVTATTRHGQARANAFLEARQMTLTGVVKAPGKATYELARAAFMGATSNIFKPRPLTVTEDIDRTCQVVKAGKVRLEMAGLAAFTFEVPLTADDPLKYGPKKTVTIPAGSNSTLINAGNFVTERIVLTTQSDGDVRINNDVWGDVGIRTQRSVGDDAVFDFYRRTVCSDSGRAIYYALSPLSAWWGLQPGENLIRNRSEMTVKIDYYDAWL